MSNGSEVLIYLSFLLKEAVIYLVAAATLNKHMVAMYQKLSFSDFILFYNSKNRHLEFLNLSPQGLISSVFNRKPSFLRRYLGLFSYFHPPGCSGATQGKKPDHDLIY